MIKVLGVSVFLPLILLALVLFQPVSMLNNEGPASNGRAYYLYEIETNKEAPTNIEIKSEEPVATQVPGLPRSDIEYPAPLYVEPPTPLPAAIDETVVPPEVEQVSEAPGPEPEDFSQSSPDEDKPEGTAQTPRFVANTNPENRAVIVQPRVGEAGKSPSNCKNGL